MRIKKTSILAAMLMMSPAILGGCSGESNPLAPQVATQVDTSPPAAPAALTAAQAGSTVKLSWSPNTVDSDLAGYNLYLLLRGREIILNGTLITGHWFIDQTPFLGDCRYAVTAVDNEGNESSWTMVFHQTSLTYPDRES